MKRKSLARRAAGWIVNGIFLLGALAFAGSILGGCAVDAQREQEIAAVENRIGELSAELAAVNDDAAAGKIGPEVFAARVKALEEKIASLRKKLEYLKAQPPAGLTFLETVLTAAAVALGLRGAPTGGLGGIVVSLLTGLFKKKEKIPEEGPA